MTGCVIGNFDLGKLLSDITGDYGSIMHVYKADEISREALAEAIVTYITIDNASVPFLHTLKPLSGNEEERSEVLEWIKKYARYHGYEKLYAYDVKGKNEAEFLYTHGFVVVPTHTGLACLDL